MLERPRALAAPPRPGEHNRAVLGGLPGLRATQLDGLRARGVI